MKCSSSCKKQIERSGPGLGWASDKVWCLDQCSAINWKSWKMCWPCPPAVDSQVNSKVVRWEWGFHCVFTFISQHPEMCWRGLLRGKVFANQSIGQHVTEYFWPVGWSRTLIKEEYSVWTSYLAQGSRTSWGQNSHCGAVGLILWCLRELVDAPDRDFLNSFISNRPTLHCWHSFTLIQSQRPIWEDCCRFSVEL